MQIRLYYISKEGNRLLKAMITYSLLAVDKRNSHCLRNFNAGQPAPEKFTITVGRMRALQ